LISPHHLIPIRERENITKMVRFSPSALKFTLSLDNIDIIESMLILVPYSDYTDRIINTVFYAIKDIDILDPKNTPEKFSGVVREALTDWEKSFHSPLYNILQSLLIFDLQYGDIVESEGFWEFYQTLFNEPSGASK
jgi:hypothetical protein